MDVERVVVLGAISLKKARRIWRFLLKGLRIYNVSFRTPAWKIYTVLASRGGYRLEFQKSAAFYVITTISDNKVVKALGRVGEEKAWKYWRVLNEWSWKIYIHNHFIKIDPDDYKTLSLFSGNWEKGDKWYTCYRYYCVYYEDDILKKIMLENTVWRTCERINYLRSIGLDKEKISAIMNLPPETIKWIGESGGCSPLYQYLTYEEGKGSIASDPIMNYCSSSGKAKAVLNILKNIEDTISRTGKAQIV